MKNLLTLALTAFWASNSIFAAADIADGKVTFSIKAPKAAEVRLKGQWSKEAEFFEDPQELVLKASELIADTKRRNEIAENGFKRINKLECRYSDQVKKILSLAMQSQ